MHTPRYYCTARAGMILAMDEAIGKVMAKLKELNVADNTIVVFASDV